MLAVWESRSSDTQNLDSKPIFVQLVTNDCICVYVFPKRGQYSMCLCICVYIIMGSRQRVCFMLNPLFQSASYYK